MSLRRAAEWKLHEAELSLLRHAHPLRYLFMEVTRRCNLACAYCGSSCNGAAQGKELPIHEWIALAREIAEDFDSSKVMVAVTGGEPLVKEGIFDLFVELGRLGFSFGMVCNCQLLDADAARRVVVAGMRSISLSMDAPPALNDELRGRGASDKVIAAVGHLKAAGFKGKLEIISTITTPAIPHLEEMRRFVAGLQVPLWRISPVMPIGRAAERKDLVPDRAGLRRILEFVRDARGDARLPVPELCEEGFLGVEFEKKVRSFLWNCLAGITIAGIMCDGRIGACPELGEAFVQGDLHRDRFSDVWRERYQVFRDRSWTRKGACATCDEFGRCQGGSLHLYASPTAEPLRCLLIDAVRPGTPS